MFKRTLVAAMVFGMAALAPPAQAQQRCGPRDGIVTQLAKKYGEYHRASGLSNPARMVEVWTSPKTGTFTILITRPNGMSCVAATGLGWLEYEPVPPAMGTAG